MEQRIILAAGHGGGDNGAAFGFKTEAAECVDIVNRVAEKLRRDGRVESVVVPHTLNLSAQIAWINARFGQREDGYCLEVHKNAGGGTGVEAWYLAGSDTARTRAATVLAELSRVSRLRQRGVFPDTNNLHGRLGWVRQTRPWAGLFECGFIDRDHYLNDLYAEGIYRGVLRLWSLPDPVVQLYRVRRQHAQGPQVGAYSVRSNAWRAWLGIDGEGVILGRADRDVTGEFIEEFGGDRSDERDRDEFEPGFEPIVHDIVVLRRPELLPEQAGTDPLGTEDDGRSDVDAEDGVVA